MERLFFLLVRLVTVLLAVSSADGGNRRILHPIFPDDSAPQNKLVPPPPADADQDEPFFPEESSLGNQTPTNGSVAIPTATKPTKPSNKPTVIAASVGIGVLSSAAALLYLIHRHKAKKQKPLEDPHSSFLYIPHNKTSVPSTPPPYFHPEIESSLPRRPKFRAPPPPPNLALLQSLTNPRHHIPKLSPTASTPAELPPKVRTTWTSYIKTPTSFQLNEDPMANNSYKSLTTTPSLQNNNIILDPKRLQNVAILARALNVTLDEVSQTLFDGDSEALGAETLEALMKMAPNKEEEIKLKAYKGDTSKLGSADKFLKAIVDIPFAFRRVEAMIYRENFDAEIEYLRKSFETLEEASSELMNSRLFLKLLQTVLTTGNRMNAGTNRGGAKGFRLDTLLKLVDIKGADGKTTLLHFVVQEIIRSQDTDDLGSQRNSRDKEVEFTRQGLIVVARLNRELGKVKLAAGMNSDALRSNVSKLETGLHKLKTILQYERSEMKGNFLESMQAFVKKAEEEICRIKKIERKALTLVREVAEYFHGGGDAVEKEAHSLRIFIIVRDFISTLDHVCKDVGTMQESTVMGADRSFRISLLPVVGRYNAIKDDSSSEGSSSP